MKLCRFDADRLGLMPGELMDCCGLRLAASR
jgi:hypothetical protein